MYKAILTETKDWAYYLF